MESLFISAKAFRKTGDLSKIPSDDFRWSTGTTRHVSQVLLCHTDKLIAGESLLPFQEIYDIQRQTYDRAS